MSNPIEETPYGDLPQIMDLMDKDLVASIPHRLLLALAVDSMSAVDMISSLRTIARRDKSAAAEAYAHYARVAELILSIAWCDAHKAGVLDEAPPECVMSKVNS